MAFPTRRLPGALLAAFVALVFAYLVLPIFVIVPMSFSSQEYLSFPPSGWSLRWYRTMAENQAWAAATLNSFLIGIPAAVLSVLFGTLAALAVTRGQLRRATAVSAFFIAPMMLPHVVIAIGLYPVMLDLGLLRTRLAAIIGHTVVAMPLVFITVSASLRTYSGALELAAMTLGANRWRTFRYVTFPMIRMGVIAGGIFAFATSFDELMLSLFLTGAYTRTLPRLIWEQMNDYLTPTIAAVTTLFLAFSLMLLGLVAALRRKGAVAAGAAIRP